MSSQSITLDIQSDVDRMVRQMKADTKHVKPALNKTLNLMATTIRKDGVKNLSKKTGLQQKKLREAITIIRANFTTMSARIEARGKPFNLASFSAKAKKVGGRMGVTAKPWNKQRFFPKAFVLNVPGKPIFKRIGKGRRGIKPVYGPGVARESLREPIIELYNRTGVRRFRVVFPRELRNRMSRRVR